MMFSGFISLSKHDSVQVFNFEYVDWILSAFAEGVGRKSDTCSIKPVSLTHIGYYAEA